MVSSASATQRLKLWNQYSGPIDQETIKAEFFRKVHSKNPPFRVKLPPKPKDRAVIPEMVEYHYKNPPDLLPSLKEVLRYEQAYKRYGPIEPTTELVNEILDENITAFDEANKKVDEFIRDIEGIPTEGEDEIMEVKIESQQESFKTDDEATRLKAIEEQIITDDKPAEKTPKRKTRGKRGLTSAEKKQDIVTIEPECKKMKMYQCGDKTYDNENDMSKYTFFNIILCTFENLIPIEKNVGQLFFFLSD